MNRALPLRVVLVAAMLLLVACGLLASGIAVTSILRHSLFERVDQNLMEEAAGWAHEMPEEIPTDSGPNPARPPSNYFVQTIDARGNYWMAVNDGRALPALPDDGDVGPVPVTVGSIDNPEIRWRAVSVSGPRGDCVTVAVDLIDVNSTLRSLIWLQIGIGLGVLVVLAVLSSAVVQRSLRPLVEIEEAAAAIAAGELDRRVPQRDPRTEVGQLSLALNGMLAQIQRGVAASDASADQARGSEERMRRFITDASHELRTPLTTIRGFAELYRQGAARDMDLLMTRIEGEARRMGVLVEDLLVLARMDAQRPLERRRVDLLALASDAVHDARAVAPGRAISLEVLDGPGTPEVIGDDARLRQVLGNLVANALQHTPSTAPVVLRVGTVGDDAVLEVQDAGPGIAPADAERVFERFYRADTSRTRASGGTGLGLSIVDALVRAHAGRVSVRTAPGEGCCFRVEIPRVTESEFSSVPPARR